MRLKATLNNPVGLHKLGQTLGKLGPLCVASLTTKELKFISLQTDQAGMISWITMQPSTMFSNYRIESRRENHQITFSFQWASLTAVTKDLLEAERIELKLKQSGDQNVLFFSFITKNFCNSACEETKELVIEMTNPDRIALIENPVAFCMPDTYILLPELTDLRNTAGGYKSVNKFLTLSANMLSEFKIEAKGTYAKAVTHYEGLVHPQLEGHILDRDPEEFSSVQIRSDDFVRFLNCAMLEPDTVVCAMTDEQQLTFYVYLTLDSYQNLQDAPIQPLHPTRCQLTCQVPLFQD